MTGTAGERGHNPVSRAFAILRCMVDSAGDGDVGVREIAGRAGMPPSAAHRTLGLLEEAGVVTRDAASGRYALGFDFLRMARVATEGFPLSRTARPLLQELVARYDETALLNVYDYQRMQLFVATGVESTQPIRYTRQLDRWLPVHAGATGLAILAHLTEVERDRVIEHHGLPALTERTIVDREELAGLLARIRNEGFAVSRGQRLPGAAAIAAPVFDSRRVIGDVALTIPEFRFPTDRLSKVAADVMECARGVSKALGAGV
ncbi:IclR family transcriptional regulator [Streptomyces sp. 4N509B]|uniref:IclR family transcriptional regulator n=1 Tax=Streptomyces sp. 4N509B TaxID=3457413 RepID=UPI003FCF1478